MADSTNETATDKADASNQRRTADGVEAGTENSAPAAHEAEGEAPLTEAERLAALEAEVVELQDKLLRAAADLQNFRRRADKERRDAEMIGASKFAKDILTVFDNLDQALQLADADIRERASGFVGGIELTHRELLNVFARHNIEILRPDLGDLFDPNQHQAMMRQPTDAVAPGTISMIVQAGFLQADRLLRPASVAVAAPTPAAAAAEEPSPASSLAKAENNQPEGGAA